MKLIFNVIYFFAFFASWEALSCPNCGASKNPSGYGTFAILGAFILFSYFPLFKIYHLAYKRRKKNL